MVIFNLLGCHNVQYQSHTNWHTQEMIAVYFLKFSFRINYENLHSGNNVKFEKKKWLFILMKMFMKLYLQSM